MTGPGLWQRRGPVTSRPCDWPYDPVTGPGSRQRRGGRLLVHGPGVLGRESERGAERLTPGAVLVAVLAVEPHERGGHQHQK